MSISKENRWKNLHDEMMQAFNRSYPSQSEVRLQCLQDRRFVSVPSAQWEGNLQQQFANRPRFEINKIANAVQRIFCEYRNNRISVDFRPEDGATDENAELLDGLFRADEQKCNAQEAYDNAFDEGVSGGFGAWRLCYDYEYPEDEEDERQRIRMEPIYDADSSVFFDIDAKRQDKADAKMCWVISSMSRYEYEEKYGAMGSSFDQVETLGMFDWFSPDVVKIAEYYVVRKKKKTYNIYRLEITGDEERLEEDDEEAAAELIAQGYMLARQKRMEQEYVQKYIVDGSRILEDCGRIAGKCIPVVPFYGKRAYIDNVERIQGHVRLTTDTMRLYNMLISMLAEIATYNWIEKPILTPEQIQGHEYTWANDNLARNPYLLLNPITGPQGEQQAAGPVGYTKPPTIPQALAALIQLVGADMQELLGAQDKGEEIVSNISAKAIELIQTRLDMQTFIYMDNMAKAMKRCGVVWLHMAKDLYNEEKRKMKTLGYDGTEDSVELMRPVATDDGITYENDLSGRFDVNVDVGPSFTSRRDGTVRTLAGLMNLTQDPAERSTLMGVILNNIDGEGLDGLKEYNRSKLIRQGIVKPNDEEAAALQQEQANQQPDPQAQYLIAEAGKQQALAVKAKADTMAAIADSEKTQAETAKLIAETSGDKLDQIIKAIEALQMAGNPNKKQIEEVVA